MIDWSIRSVQFFGGIFFSESTLCYIGGSTSGLLARELCITSRRKGSLIKPKSFDSGHCMAGNHDRDTSYYQTISPSKETLHTHIHCWLWYIISFGSRAHGRTVKLNLFRNSAVLIQSTPCVFLYLFFFTALFMVSISLFLAAGRSGASLVAEAASEEVHSSLRHRIISWRGLLSLYMWTQKHGVVLGQVG